MPAPAETEVPAGAEVAIEIQNIDMERKRIGVALVEEGSSKAERAAGSGRPAARGASAGQGRPAGRNGETGEGQGQTRAEGLGSLADQLRDAMKKKDS